MNGSGRDDAPFSGRVWQEIDYTIDAVRAANCTARRFLEIDGPYGPGLTSVAGEERWLRPTGGGMDPGAWRVRRQEWNARRAERQALDEAPIYPGAGSYIVRGESRPVPLIVSEFTLGTRAVEAYEAGFQPLDLCGAARAARGVALEEERLLYYGSRNDPEALLRTSNNTTPIDPAPASPIDSLHRAIEQLALRGYAGPFALTVEPRLYTQIYAPNAAESRLRVDLLRNLFRGGIYLAPVIDPSRDKPANRRRGAVVTVGRAYSRLVVGQDWVTTYLGRSGVLHRFLISSSLQLRTCDPPLSIQVLTRSDGEGQAEGEATGEAPVERY